MKEKKKVIEEKNEDIKEQEESNLRKMIKKMQKRRIEGNESRN